MRRERRAAGVALVGSLTTALRGRLACAADFAAALLIVLVAFTPTLLFGEPLSAFDLMVLGVSLLGAGLLLRWPGRARAATLGAMLAIIGAVVLAIGIGLTGLLLLGWGRS